jgi:hypothetical protein
MKMLRFLPLAFLCGAHGFALFAPYLAAFLALAHYVDKRSQRAGRAAAA